MLNLRNYSACSIKYSYSSIQIKVSCPIFVGKTEIHRCLPFSTFRIKRIAAFFQKTNIVKGESRNKRETKFHDWIMPSRLLYSTNIVKGESRDKGKMEFSRMNYAEPPPIFYKYSERREQRQKGKWNFHE